MLGFMCLMIFVLPLLDVTQGVQRVPEGPAIVQFLGNALRFLTTFQGQPGELVPPLRIWRLQLLKDIPESLVGEKCSMLVAYRPPLQQFPACIDVGTYLFHI